MLASIEQPDHRYVMRENGEPRCGDFCDQCGDCLHCYADDECPHGGNHSWVVYLRGAGMSSPPALAVGAFSLYLHPDGSTGVGRVRPDGRLHPAPAEEVLEALAAPGPSMKRALRAAAESLRTVERMAGKKDELLDSWLNVRGYAGNRAKVALSALEASGGDAPPPALEEALRDVRRHLPEARRLLSRQFGAEPWQLLLAVERLLLELEEGPR